MKSYAVAPGEYLAEWMEEHPLMTQAQLAERLDVSRKLVNEIINAKAPVSPTVATRLERVTSIPAKAWLLYQAQYDADVARREDISSLAGYANIISVNLGSYLRKVGATSATMRDAGQLVADFLAHIQCGTINAFEQRCRLINGGAAFATLKESGKSIDPAMLLAWVAQAEKQDSNGDRFVAKYSEDRLIEAIPLVRKRAQSPDDRMLDDIRAILANAGVTMLYCEPPKGFPLHGVTYWVNDAPVVVFTARRKTDGYITWAVFHELGHVLHDERCGESFGLDKSEKQKEREERTANSFAKRTLFGDAGMSSFYGLSKPAEIRRAAKQIGVSPGVAVVAMHKKRMLPYDCGNALLVDVMA